MADGRLKIGSDFLKIGSLYLRIGPAPTAIEICDDFESGVGDWTFTDIGTGTHSWTTDDAHSPTHSIKAELIDIADSVRFTRTTPVDVTAMGDICEIHFWATIPSGGEDAYFDILIDGDVFYKMSVLLGGSVQGPPVIVIRGDSGDVYTDFGLLIEEMIGAWAEFTLRINKALGEYVDVTFNGNVYDLTGVAGDAGLGSQPGVIDAVWRTIFEHDVAYDLTFLFDDICIGEPS